MAFPKSRLNLWCLAMKVWVVKLLGGPSAWERKVLQWLERWPCTGNSRFFGCMECAFGGLSSCLAVRTLQMDLAWGDKVLHRESKSPPIEALGLRLWERWADGASSEVQSVVFGRQVA